jgi:hypothetical protein
LKLNKNFRTQIPTTRTPAGGRTMQALAYAHMTARAKSTDDAQRSSTEFATGYRHARIRFKIVQSMRARVTGAALAFPHCADEEGIRVRLWLMVCSVH